MRHTTLRLAMVGGGRGSLIGPVHRRAAELDGRFRLVAGAFSRDPQQSQDAGADYGLPDDRVYPDWQSLLAGEANRPDGAQVVAIVAPNHLHMPVAVAALQTGFHVMSEKPATISLAEALTLRDAVQTSGRHYALTYTYSGYQMVRHARALVARGRIGTVRKVVVEYAQGWLSQQAETSGNRQAEWRVDPSRAGAGGAISDIGVHAFQLAEYVSGERVSDLIADIGFVVPGRAVDDDCALLLRFQGGARGVLLASQIATGERNRLTLHVYGTDGSLCWTHEKADILTLNRPDGGTEILHAGSAGLTGPARLPSGHPEGFIEAIGNLYVGLADAIQGTEGLIDVDIPGIETGVRSMAFIERALENGRTANGWLGLEQ